MMDREERFWDRIANMYARQSVSDVEAYQFKHEKIKSLLRPSDVVFDYGCGTASTSIELSGAVREIHAIDISSRMLEIASDRTQEKGINNIHFGKNTLFDAGFEPESFDVVLAVNILHFADNVDNDLAQINRLLKPNGYLVTETPCMGEEKKLANKLVFYLGRMGLIPRLNMLTFKSYEASLAGSGFAITYKKNMSKTPRDYFVIARKM